MSWMWHWNKFTLSLFHGNSRDYHLCAMVRVKCLESEKISRSEKSRGILVSVRDI